MNTEHEKNYQAHLLRGKLQRAASNHDNANVERLAFKRRKPLDILVVTTKTQKGEPVL